MPTSNEIVPTTQSVDVDFSRTDGLYCAPSKERGHLINTIANPTLTGNATVFDTTWKPVWVDADEIKGEGVPYLYEALYLLCGCFQKGTRWSHDLRVRGTETRGDAPVRVLGSVVVEVDGCSKDRFLVAFISPKVDLPEWNGSWLQYGQNLVGHLSEMGVPAWEAEPKEPPAAGACHPVGFKANMLDVPGSEIPSPHSPVFGVKDLRVVKDAPSPMDDRPSDRAHRGEPETRSCKRQQPLPRSTTRRTRRRNTAGLGGSFGAHWRERAARRETQRRRRRPGHAIDTSSAGRQ
ncbi:hypothetical protein PG991_011744 [Apiospora marii]|uniref:Uncharacterized protein n=1 Tax=Apiospora marii TaxID=335849 RepID=A0ABR1RF60_9PEZI